MKTASERYRFVSQMAAEDAECWKLYIWCKLILRDSWKDIDPDSNPFESCSHTVLFRLLKLAWSSSTWGWFSTLWFSVLFAWVAFCLCVSKNKILLRVVSWFGYNLANVYSLPDDVWCCNSDEWDCPLSSQLQINRGASLLASFLLKAFSYNCFFYERSENNRTLSVVTAWSHCYQLAWILTKKIFRLCSFFITPNAFPQS